MAVAVLLRGGSEPGSRADVDERVQSGWSESRDGYDEDDERAKQISLSMSTALHLANTGSPVARQLAPQWSSSSALLHRPAFLSVVLCVCF